MPLSRSLEFGQAYLLFVKTSFFLHDPGLAVEVTRSKCNARDFGRVINIGRDASLGGHESLVGFILRGGGRADGVTESSICREVPLFPLFIVPKMYQFMPDSEGEDLLSDFTRKLQKWGCRTVEEMRA